MEQVKKQFTRLRTLFPSTHFLFFPGNHEYRAVNFNDKILHKLCLEFGIHWVQDKTVSLVPKNEHLDWHIHHNTDISPLGTRHRWICSTLWTDMLLNGNSADTLDALEIGIAIRLYKDMHNKPITIETLKNLHHQHMNTITKALAFPYTGQTTVVTHHPVIGDLLITKDEKTGALHTSNLRNVIERLNPAPGSTWKFGHVHYCKPLVPGKWNYENIALGHPFETPDPVAKLKKTKFDIKKTFILGSSDKFFQV